MCDVQEWLHLVTSCFVCGATCEKQPAHSVGLKKEGTPRYKQHRVWWPALYGGGHSGRMEFPFAVDLADYI